MKKRLVILGAGESGGGTALLAKQKGYDVYQYVLEGMIVAENLKYRKDPYKNLLYLINKQSEFRTQAENNLQEEINKFITRV